MSDEMRHHLEQHAVAYLVAVSGVLFGIGLVLQHTGRAIERAATLGGPRG